MLTDDEKDLICFFRSCTIFKLLDLYEHPDTLMIKVVVVMGVASSGKTTAGQLLAQRLDWQFYDADTYHTQSNIDKMKRGDPLTDEDRRPWLQELAFSIVRKHALMDGIGGAVLACSALKPEYRRILTMDDMGEIAAKTVFVLLNPSEEEVTRRAVARQDHHFMPVSLLQSQIEALQYNPEEMWMIFGDGMTTEAIVASVIDKLQKDQQKRKN